jgi:hypothetical protein
VRTDPKNGEHDYGSVVLFAEIVADSLHRSGFVRVCWSATGRRPAPTG